MNTPAAMGQTLSAVQGTLKGTTDANAKAAEEALKAVQDLAESQLELFYAKITSDSYDTKVIPIDKIIDKQMYIYAHTSQAPENTETIIADVGKSFADGKTAKGVGKIIDKTLDVLLGQAEAGMNKQQKYAITCGDLGNLLRLDILIFSYGFKSAAIINTASSVKAALVVVSSAKIDDLNRNTLAGIVNQTYSDSEKNVREDILDELDKMRSKIVKKE